jgi:hypothetical protein
MTFRPFKNMRNAHLRSVVINTEHILKTTKWTKLELSGQHTLTFLATKKSLVTWSLNNTLKRTEGV